MFVPGAIGCSESIYKQSGPRFLRSITQQESINQMRDLTSLGGIVNVKIPRSRATAVFVKRDPAQIDLEAENLVPKADYENKFSSPINRSISEPELNYLAENGHMGRVVFENQT